jgi:hypothetical protein
MRNRNISGRGRLPLAMSLLTAILLAGCAGRETKTVVAAPPAVENDGSSFAKAIVITAPNEAVGVNEEYIYLGQQFPGYKESGQALEQSAYKSYDVVTITNASGETKTVYFDITGFFGKNS